MTIKWHIFATIILIQLKSFHCNTIELSSYSRVAKNGNADADAVHAADKTVEVHRAREGVINSDLWQPKTESNDNDADKSTGRAIDDNHGFPFPLKDISFPSTSKASNHRYSNSKPNVVYAASPVSQIAQDRFVPRESVSYFIQKNSNRVKSSAPKRNPNESDREDDPPLGPGNKVPSNDDGKSNAGVIGPNYTPTKNPYAFPQNIGPAYPPPSLDSSDDDGKDDAGVIGPNYKPPKNLYSFPPNIGAAYSPPSPDLPPPISVSSYLPPPSGPTNYPAFPGPVNVPFPLAPQKAQDEQPDAKRPMDDDMDGPPSAPPQPPPSNDSPVKFKFNNPNDLILDPAYADQDDSQDPNQDQPHQHDDPHDHYPHGDPHDHHHHHHHGHHDHHPVIYDSPPSFQPYDDGLRHLHGYDAVPEVIFDHPHDHDFFHDHHPIALPPPPPTTPPPPPPPPPQEDLPDIEPEEQPRVKKYSYFYLARSLWYIPLYFTVWFTFYVTWLILQSIGRHAAALPNHVVNRRSIMDLTHRGTVDKVDVLTEFVMSQIDGFKDKYL